MTRDEIEELLSRQKDALADAIPTRSHASTPPTARSKARRMEW
jgi:hypothetical protein